MILKCNFVHERLMINPTLLKIKTTDNQLKNQFVLEIKIPDSIQI